VLAFVAVWAPAAPAQVRTTQDPYGKIVKAIGIESLTGEFKVSRDLIRSRLRTEVDKPLRNEHIQADLTVLWKELSLRADVSFVVVEGGVKVVFRVSGDKIFNRLEFTGLNHFKEDQVRLMLGISTKVRLSRSEADQYALRLRDRYLKDGYVHVDLRVHEDEEAGVLKIQVDEGAQVTVRDIYFRGNKTYPATTMMNLGENLTGGAKMESKARGLLRGSPYSQQTIDEDLDKLRLFYRRRGFRDAEVELEQRQFVTGRTEVDLTFRVVEGRRYKIASVKLEQRRSREPGDRRPPLYQALEIMAHFRTQAGQFFDRDLITRDKAAIERFYGKRGHPSVRRYGRNLDQAFQIGDPIEHVDYVNATVALTFQVIEGTRKTVREIRITGNIYTRDRVIRRNVKLMPGEPLDIVKFERSRQLLDRLRYFQDRQSLSGVRMELLPVPGEPDLVDVLITVVEGDTGSFVWGAGVSSGTGLRGTFQFNKRNFDITRLPSSWNPATIVSELIDSKAFHGGGQELQLFLAPGTEYSTFRLSFYEPDIFRQHIDTWGLRLQGYRTISGLDPSYDTDALGAAIGIHRNYSDNFSIGLTFRQETVDVEDIDSTAPTIVFLSEGDSEMRGVQFNLRYSDIDNPLQPRAGYRVRGWAELVGGLFGGAQDFYKLGSRAEHWYPIYADSLDRKHVIYTKLQLDYAEAFGSSDFVFPPERFYMGGTNLRGFDQRDAGPSQFGSPVGGEAMILSTVEYQFPLVSTRMPQQTWETEILRGVVFSDFGLLGLDINDPTFQEPRLTVGFGVRIRLPVLQVPIQLDLAWPVLSEDTDDEEQFFFSIRPIF
jgi:outer membrane protein insertion porin family